MRPADIQALLRQLTHSRQADATLWQMLQQPDDALYYPDAPQMTGAVQAGYDAARHSIQLIARCERAQAYRAQLIAELRQRAEQTEQLLYWINRLRADQRSVILALYAQGRTIPETASQLNLSESTIKRYRQAAIKQLSSWMTTTGACQTAGNQSAELS